MRRGLAPPRVRASRTFPPCSAATAGLPHLIRECQAPRRAGLLSRETGQLALDARTFGLRDRGLIREGMAADLVIFDPARVGDVATYQQPHQFSEGIDFVLVNGVLAVENRQLTPARGGRVLRKQP